MTGDHESRARGANVLTDKTREQAGIALGMAIQRAFRAQGLGGFWMFGFDRDESLLRDDGRIPAFMSIFPSDKAATTISFRAIPKMESAANPSDYCSDDYKVTLSSDMQKTLEVRKATITPEIFEAVMHKGGVKASELGDADIVESGRKLMDKTAQLGAAEIEAQWALGECTEEEAAYLTKLLQAAHPND